MSNCILWGNTAPGNYEISLDGTYPAELDISHSDVKGGELSVYLGTGCILNWGAGMIDADPLFADPGNDDYHLTWQSPCRNTGDNSVVTELFDFEGDPRIHDGTVDMGCDEYYYHLYHMGDVVPGGTVNICVVGQPSVPVLLAMGSGIQDPPLSTQYGDLYLTLPLANTWTLGSIPGTGVLMLSATIPLGWSPGDMRPLQALVGPLGYPNSVLTNLETLVVE
jgi:hypothetical protein